MQINHQLPHQCGFIMVHLANCLLLHMLIIMKIKLVNLLRQFTPPQRGLASMARMASAANDPQEKVKIIENCIFRIFDLLFI